MLHFWREMNGLKYFIWQGGVLIHGKYVDELITPARGGESPFMPFQINNGLILESF